ncbi:MAG: hypothetical protein E7084_05515 [Bacteroidales bacterium]|nr:hypothetical protein [Bacteroidales bacterium]
MKLDVYLFSYFIIATAYTMKKPIRTISIIAGVVLTFAGACALVKKPSPEDFVNPKITEDITGVVFPVLEIDEILKVEGPESFDFPGKTYYWVRVDYCDTTRLDTFFASIDSVIANGDTRWRKSADGKYQFDSDWADISVGDKGIFLDLVYRLWQ